MPAYRLLVLARPDVAPAMLATTFRGLARSVYRENGVFRTVENLGVRPLAYPYSSDGKKVDSARFVDCKFDIAPSSLPTLRAELDEGVVLNSFLFRNRGEDGEFRPERKEKETKTITAGIIARGLLFNPKTNEVEPVS